MTGQVYRGFLRQLSTGGGVGLLLPPYPLVPGQGIWLGRDPHCQIALDPSQYVSVSRRHAVIRPVSSGGEEFWEICDLNSVNGTYLNGQRLQGCQRLQSGDRIELGWGGPVFRFEYQSPTPLIAPPPSALNSVTFTQLFPLASTGRDLPRKAFLGPGVLTVVFVVLMFAAVGEPFAFNLLLATYLSGAASYFIYRLCGKRKPWWVLLACGLATASLLTSPLLPLFIQVFREILPGSLPNPGELVSFLSLFVRIFFGAGLMEELFKALPILAAYILGLVLWSPWRERIGVWEPLDGILLGTASAVGFTLIETLGQYVPDLINDVTLQAGEDAGQLLGLQLLIPRILGSVVGHVAYSGYFGYFIGLSVLKPRKRWQILSIGYLCAAALHALWNTTGYVSHSLLAAVGILSYSFLAAAILKAKALSPTRNEHWVTGL